MEPGVIDRAPSFPPTAPPDADDVTISARRKARWKYFGPLLGIALLYVVAYGWLLASSSFLPYVTDNNESFSAFFHGSNMFRFGIAGSFGLTDESFSPDAAAHPYVYTHGGNFPRVYTFLLYALGARSVQAQILIAAFTIGAAGMFLMYAYFSKVAGAIFATVAALVFGSDYLFFAQWQVNSYRVWHALFLFGALLCVHGIGGKRRRRYLVLLFVLEACLVYFDLTFAVFVSVFAAVYGAVMYWRRPRLLVSAWAVQFAGGAISIALLVGQSIAYLGWPTFSFDLAQTYGSRNAALAGTGAGDKLIAQLQDFYASHHVVFWHQLGSNVPLRDPGYFVAEQFGWTLQPLTPFFSLLLLVVCLGWLISRAPLVGVPERRSQTGIGARGVLNGAALVVGLVVAYFAVLLDASLLGSRAADGLQFANVPVAFLVALAAACAAGACLTRAATHRWLDFAALSPVCVMAATGFLLLTALFIRTSASMYNPDLQPLVSLGNWLPTWVAQAMGLVVVGLAVALVLRAMTVLEHTRLVAYLMCGALAYVVCYAVLPGYVVSDYLERLAPLAVYLRDVAIAITVLVLGSAAIRVSRLAGAPRGVRPLLALGAAVPLVLFGAYWLNLQREYLGLLPPTTYAFLSQLSQPPFQGASFATNVYPAPVAAQTGQWAYTDQSLGRGEVNLTDGGYMVARDYDYLWVADASSNPAYAKPDYFVCATPLNLKIVADRLTGTRFDCSRLGLVTLAGKDQVFPHERVVATDPTGRNGWQILRLDWTYPAYLARVQGLPGQADDTRVRVSVNRDDATWVVQPDYEWRQQEDLPQAPARLRLYATGLDECLIAETNDASSFVLPISFSNLVRVSVTPRTSNTAGAEYFSEPFVIGEATYILPDIRTGGAQQITATSLEEAEQHARDAGTWTPEASTGLKTYALPDIVTGTAQQVQARSLDDAEALAQTAGTWTPQAGTYGTVSTGVTLSSPDHPCSRG
ncbi:MAG: hypothetical protein JOZ87_09300 [Chloroflexi bacterium]|nr:hypothetical protein [Chloroflexota bacterium]